MATRHTTSIYQTDAGEGMRGVDILSIALKFIDTVFQDTDTSGDLRVLIRRELTSRLNTAEKKIAMLAAMDLLRQQEDSLRYEITDLIDELHHELPFGVEMNFPFDTILSIDTDRRNTN